jgi:hypothetical protein
MLYQLALDLTEMGICTSNLRALGNGDVRMQVTQGPHGPSEVKFTTKKDMDRADLIIAASEAYYAGKHNKTTD